MGVVIPFSLKNRIATMPPPRILVLGDKAIRQGTLSDAYQYVMERMSGAPVPLLHMLGSVDACVTCQLLPPPYLLDNLHILAKSKNIRIVAAVCLMQHPPRGEIEQLFPQAQIFFEDASCLRGLALLTKASQ